MEWLAIRYIKSPFDSRLATSEARKRFSVVIVLPGFSLLPYIESMIIALSASNVRTVLVVDQKIHSAGKLKDNAIYASYVTRPGFERTEVLFVPKRTENVRIFNILGLAKSLRFYRQSGQQTKYYENRWKSFVSNERWFDKFLIKGLSYFFSTKILDYAACEAASKDQCINNILLCLNPNAVLATPCNKRRSSEAMWIGAANRLDITTIVPTLSWDNLTTKGTFFAKPKYLFVWNKFHAEEAINYHGFNSNSIRIIGSLFLDKWTTHMSPNYVSSSGNRYVLYLGSSSNVVKDETSYILELAKICRDKKLNLVVRPHPSSSWPALLHKKDIENLKLSENKTTVPFNSQKFEDFNRKIRGAICVVGVNTTAMLDAISAGVPVVALLRKELSETQSKTLHFRHLIDGDGIDCVSSLDEFRQYLDGFESGKIVMSGEKSHNFRAQHLQSPGPYSSAGEHGAAAIFEFCNAKGIS